VTETRHGEGGFLTLRRAQLVTVGAHGRSDAFAYDVVDRRALDASVMAAIHLEGGVEHVWLRSCVRPPIALRSDNERMHAGQWELPAGLIEPGENPRAAAARELEEELGFRVDEQALHTLGPSAFPSPGFVGELHHFFWVRVDPSTRAEPAGDGSPLEAGAAVVAIPLRAALAACQQGLLRDEKTELGLRRLADVLEGSR
jgi:ADP-ribose pyrophosphatase